jgi:hypothetical protein
MIPWFIQQACPTYDLKSQNIKTNSSSSESNELNDQIINYIIDTMNQICTSNNLTISSYDDFCDKYWNTIGFYINNWNNVFKVNYYDNNWIEWDLSLYKNDIYTAYTNKYN